MPMKKKPANRVLAAIQAHQWLISDEWLETIVSIASRENDLEAFKTDKELMAELNDPSALLTTHDGVIAGTNAVKRGSHAVIPILGPIFPRANLFTMYSGGASVETVARDTQIAKAQGLDPVLYISSPGGVVEGISEYAQLVASMDVTAFVTGNCTSAAYWIASQCQSIVVSDTAVIGNIGVKGPNPSGKDDSIVSDNAPNKIMTAGMVKGIVNDIESVFLSAVASGRNTTVEDVKENFGKGGVFVGQKAVDARLADGVSTLEAFLNLSANQARETYRKPEMAITQEQYDAKNAEVETLKAQLATAQAATSEQEQATADAKAEASEAERNRIEAIMAAAPDKPKAAHSLAMTTPLTVEQATAALANMPVEASSNNDPLQAAMDGTNPDVSGDADADKDDSQAAASWDDIIKGVAA